MLTDIIAFPFRNHMKPRWLSEVLSLITLSFSIPYRTKMAPAFDATNYIYQGVWMDWSRGGVSGTTLTLSPSNAAILSSGLAILISIAGAQLWRLLQFSLHQARATADERNFIYHQTQAVLRNTATDLNALWRFLRIAFAWRNHRNVHLARTIIPLLLWTMLHLGLVIVAGVLSSWLLEDGDNVLSISPWCGIFDQQYIDSVAATTVNDTFDALTRSTEYYKYTNSRFVLAQQALDICASGTHQCMESSTKSLPYTYKFAQNECPLNASICHPQAGGSMEFDTGFLSSHTHLGYNARPEDRISIRMLTQCVPLKAEGYVSTWQTVWDQDNQISQQVSDARYGIGRLNSRNATASITKQSVTCDEKMSQPAYKLVPFAAFPRANGTLKSGTMTPIPDLYPGQFDLSLIVSSYGNTYSQPVTDPWFSSDQPVNSTSSSSMCAIRNVTMYTRKHPLSTMACTQQFQICNSDSISGLNDGRCTKPVGRYQLGPLLYSENPVISLTPRQQALVDRIYRINLLTSPYYVIYALVQTGANPLSLKYQSSTLPLPAIPATQWRNETEYWQQLMLAYYRQANLDYSTGQFAASTNYINVTKPSSAHAYINANVTAAQDAAKWLCESQIIQSKEYRNFSFFWLVFTASFCTIIIVLGLSIEDITGFVRARRLNHPGRHPKQDMWNANSDLDMLRYIDELKSGTRWSLSGNGIPITSPTHVVSGRCLTTKGSDMESGNFARLDTRPYKDSPYGRHNDRDHKCLTCSQFELSSVSRSNMGSKSDVGTENQQEELMFENVIPNTSVSRFRRSIPGVLVR